MPTKDDFFINQFEKAAALLNKTMKAIYAYCFSETVGTISMILHTVHEQYILKNKLQFQDRAFEFEWLFKTL